MTTGQLHHRRTYPRVAILLALLSGLFVLIGTRPAHADTTTADADLARTSWYPTQPALSPQTVTGGGFGQLFSTSVTGQVYAQPLVAAQTLLVATETNDVYGLDPHGGTQIWHDNLGVPFIPANFRQVSNCSDLSPDVGITSTPVVDPSTNIEYLTSKTLLADGVTPVYYVHALSVTTGVEQPGFPVALTGSADNDPTHTFYAMTQLQRPGLLLLNGVIYAAFGAHCDDKPYEGWVFGVSTAGSITARWTDEAGVSQTDPLGPGGGIWASGGGLLSDGPGQIVLSTGNGDTLTTPTPGSTPPGALAQSVIRLGVQANGTLKATDFFAPYDASSLNANDSDLGAGAPVELPSAYFGTSAHPNLIAEIGKQGYMYLLDAKNLGGFEQGPAGSDNVVFSALGNGGCWCKPAVWPGDGGYIYVTTAGGGGGAGKLQAWKYGLDGQGNPTLALQGTSSDGFGFASSSASVTSSGTTSGSALVWTVWIPTNASSPGAGAQLRAYNPVPVNGQLQLAWSAPIGTATKFSPPQIDNGTVYVGTRDGHVLGFGSPVASPVTGLGLAFPQTTVGSSSTLTETLTATQSLTITSVSAGAGLFQAGSTSPALPAALATGQTLTVPVTFTPGAPGSAGGTLQVVNSAGPPVNFGLTGAGQAPGPYLATSGCCLSFGGVTAGGQASGSVTLTNNGASPLHLTGINLPNAPYTVTGLPAVGAPLASGQSVTAAVTFAPQSVGLYTDSLGLTSDGGNATISLDGSGGTPPQMQISNTSLEYGSVPVGVTATLTFSVHNAGGTPLTITKSKPPGGVGGFSEVTALAEDSTLQPGQTQTERVNFTPTALGDQTATWIINANDGAGVRTVNFDGTGIAAPIPSLAAGDLDVIRPAAGTTVANFPVTLSAPSTATVTVNYSTKDGSATAANGDYLPAVNQTLTFAPGQTTQSIPITVNGATTPATTTFSIVLSKASSGAVIGQAYGKAYLTNLVLPPSIYVGDTSVAAPTGGGTATLNFPVSVAPFASGQVVTITAATADGTAKAANHDYTPLTTTLTFSGTTTTQNVAVPVLHAPASGTNSTVLLNLSNRSTGSNIARLSATGTVVNGAAPAVGFYIGDSQVFRPTSGTVAANFTVSVSPPPTTPVSVLVSDSANGSLVSGVDYQQFIPQSLTFLPGGPTSQTVVATVNGSVTSSGTGTIGLGLSKATVGSFIADAGSKGYVVSPIRDQFVAVQALTTWASPAETTTVNVPITLQSAANVAVTVTAATGNPATAIAGTDYQAMSAPVTIPAGQTQGVLPVTINPATPGGAAKTFTVSLTATGNTVIVDPTATVTIVAPTTNVTVPPTPVAPVFTADLPSGSGTVGAQYGYTFAASGYPTPTFAVVEGGQLPPGLTLDPTGILAGTPTTPGTYSFSVQASNGVGTPAVSPPVTITMAPPPSGPGLTADSPPATASLGVSYSYTFTATGQPVPTFAISSGTLPPGLNLDPNAGTLSGTPTAQGVYSFTVSAGNGIDIPAQSPELTITVGLAPAITSAATASTTTGRALSFTVTTAGTPTPALSETGVLPSGVTFTDNGNGTATLAGTPPAGTGGVYPLTIAASNGIGAPVTQSFTLTVTGSGPQLTGDSPPGATQGTGYSYTFTASGDPAPTFSVASGSLPAGLSLNATTGVMSGTPTQPGTSTFTVSASNISGPPSTSPVLTVVVAPSLAGPTITSATSTAVVSGQPLSFTVTTTGYPTPTLSAAGLLPAGITFTDNGNGTATLAGTSSGAPGLYTVTITAHNPSGPDAQQTFTLSVQTVAAITSANATTATVGTPLSFTVTATGYPTPKLTITGALPAGVTFTDNGNGTATLAGTPAAGTEGSPTLTIGASNGVGTPAQQTFSLTVNGVAPTFTADTPPGTATTTTAYNYTFVASGDPAPTYTVNSGSPPPGLSLAPTTGALSGTPTAAGTYTFTVAATNTSGSPAVSPAITILVNPTDVTANLTGPTSVPVGTANMVYTVTITNTGTALATGLGATFALPPGTAFSSAQSGGTYSGGIVTWAGLASLSPGQHVNIKVTLSALQTGTVVGSTTVYSANPDPNLLNNIATFTSRIK